MAAFFYHIIILELYICFPIFFLYSLLYLLKNWHLDYNMIILFQIVTEEILLQGLTLKSRERTQIISFYMCNLFVAVFMTAFFYHIIILELYICFPLFFLYSLLYLLKNWHLDYNMIILFQIVTEEILLQGLTLKSRERTQIISFYMCNLFVAVFMAAFFVSNHLNYIQRCFFYLII